MASRLLPIAAAPFLAASLVACASDPGLPADDASPALPPSAPSPTATTPDPEDPPDSEPEPRSFTLVASGDVLLHEPLWEQAERDAHPDGTWDFAPQLRHVQPVVDGADLAICHLEVPIAPDDGPFEGFPTFAGPPQIVTALAETGYDACTTASNHIFDQGADGVDRTLDALDEAGLSHVGSARTEDEAVQPTVITVDASGAAVDVGLVSYTFSFNGIPYPGGEEWRSNLIDEDAILEDAEAARDAGAEVVVVALHWGDEYVHEPNARQLELAPRLIESEHIDLLLGHHAHVVQPMEEFDGQWVVYGMGNLMANHAEPEDARAEGLMVRFTFTEDPDGGSFGTTAVEYLPVFQTYEPPLEVLPLPRALARGEYGSAGEERLREAMDRTVAVVKSRGAADAGAAMIE